MPASTVTIARYVLIETRRSGLPWLAADCVFVALGLAGFLSQVAITEGAALQAAAAAALLRACAIFLVIAYVAASVVREANDKGLELALALPISRPAWYLGKLLGYACAGALLAAFFALPLTLWAAPADLAAWTLAVAAEAAVMAAAALFFASALGQTVSAIAAAAGLYLLARALPAIQAIASGPHAVDSTPGQVARWSIDAIALLLPRLEGAASADWLLYGAPPASALVQALLALAIYFAVLAAAGLFDFSRRNL
ncbi:MAG: ABC transporter permease subunit [Burkholderiales bacterium]|nr:ABC transporter permease subunit [Burkholderiales bacterium]